MKDRQSKTWRETALKWGVAIAMALVVAYSAHPLLTVLLQLAEEQGSSTGPQFPALIFAGLLVVFAGALLALAGQKTLSLRVEKGCLWSGALLWLTIPVMVLMVFVVAAAETGADQGGATAAFFMLMIFGGYCAIIGSVFLLIAFFLRRQRLAAPGNPPGR